MTRNIYYRVTVTILMEYYYKLIHEKLAINRRIGKGHASVGWKTV